MNNVAEIPDPAGPWCRHAHHGDAHDEDGKCAAFDFPPGGGWADCLCTHMKKMEVPR